MNAKNIWKIWKMPPIKFKSARRTQKNPPIMTGFFISKIFKNYFARATSAGFSTA